MNWRKTDDSLTVDIILRIEKEIELNFPKDFVSFIIKNNHGRPEKPVFDTSKSKGRFFGALLNFNIEKKHSDNFLEVYKSISATIPNGFFPFASDPSGNYLCAEIQKDEVVNVYLWNHEKEFEIDRENNDFLNVQDYHTLEYVSDSLKNFLNKLYIPE